MNQAEVGRRAVVTGGARGIGRAIVQRLAQDGFAVTALDVLQAELECTIADLRNDNLTVSGAVVDVTVRASVAHQIAMLEHVDVVVAAHGLILVKPFELVSDEEFSRIVQVNLSGTFVLFQECLKKMSAGGKLIGLASRGVLGDTQTAPYIASKAAIVGLIRALAFEYRSRDISVNAIAPGFTNTHMVRDNLSAERFAAASKSEPRGRPADPSEIAHAVAFLAAKATKFITGQTLFVDGGKSLGGLTAAV